MIYDFVLLCYCTSLDILSLLVYCTYEWMLKAVIDYDYSIILDIRKFL